MNAVKVLVGDALFPYLKVGVIDSVECKLINNPHLQVWELKKQKENSCEGSFGKDLDYFV